MTAEGSLVCHRCSAAKGDFLSVGSRTIKTIDAWRKKITRVASGIDLPDILCGTSAQVVRDAVLIFSSTRSG